MAEDKTLLAIFDFDGTLTEGHLWQGIAKHHQEKRVKRRAVLLYLATHMPYWVAAKIRLISQENNRATWGEDLAVLFKGFTAGEARKIFEWVTDHYFMPLMRADVMEKLKAHHQDGYKVVLLSGMFSEFLEIIGQRLGVDYVVGTRLEKRDDTYTGRIIRPLCFGENKSRLLLDFVSQNQLNVDFSRSIAYADSIYDMPVFKLVGHPVPTYPDKELYRFAIDKKWPIIGHPNGFTINHI